MGKVIPFGRKIPPASNLTPQEQKEAEEVAIASIDAKVGAGLIRSSFSQDELDNFIKELDAMEDPEDE